MTYVQLLSQVAKVKRGIKDKTIYGLRQKWFTFLDRKVTKTWFDELKEKNNEKS